MPHQSRSILKPSIDQTTPDVRLADMHLTEAEAVTVVYTNYRGETAVRRIVPKQIWFGSTEWHPEAGWLLDAYDVDKKADRSFAMTQIKAWFVEQ